MSWMRKDVRGLEETGTVCWAVVGLRLIPAGVLLGALCLLAGSTPALILLFLALPGGALASHPPGAAFIGQAAKPPPGLIGDPWQESTPFVCVLAPAGFQAVFLSFLHRDALPHGSVGSQPNLSLLLCPALAPFLANPPPRGFMMKRRMPKRVHPFFGDQNAPGVGVLVRGGGSSVRGMLCKGTAAASPAPAPAPASRCSACSCLWK